jgi:superfamily II DNA or RNA helicase
MPEAPSEVQSEEAPDALEPNQSAEGRPTSGPLVRGLAPRAPGLDAAEAPLTPFHQRLLAEELALSQSGAARVASALTTSTVDLNPHQIEAAAFALEALPRGGGILADEVGLGKTIEAGIVIAQLAAEGRGRILILCPASLRAQWQGELLDKFGLKAVCVDGDVERSFRGNLFEQNAPVIASIQFGANRAEQLARIVWDLVVVDEAHRLRNAWRPNHKTGTALRSALEGRPKLLLTATPLQNDLMELYGLVSFLDAAVLGPEHAFRARYTGCADEEAPTALNELKSRIAPVVQRTLRRQVREYVKFTARRSMVEDFTYSPAEADLYEKVGEYLRRAELLAIEPGRRTLLTLVYRKLLASSTYAIAPTLRRLADGLEQRIAAAKANRQFELSLSSEEREELKEFDEELEEIEQGPEAAKDEPRAQRRPPTIDALEGELFELRAYADLAASIRVNAKGEALSRAIDRAFTVAASYGWPLKAVIFTESKRTQEYLSTLLSERGYRGRISLLSGDGSGPDARRLLVEEFRERTQILISTEAGAEGLNLQFCNLIVNYDLPWNPQRVEQRIGRCHRYGQTRDVLVINFVNRSNAADARLFELLEKKLTLFDGVFGASDEILGALESGVDFERRVLDIYQSCRTEQEVNRAFDELRGDLEKRIGARMTQARDLLFERFDGDVRSRLRLTGSAAKAAIERRKKGSRALTRAVLGREDATQAQVEEAARAVRGKPAPAISYLALNGAELPARLAHLAGSQGWWFVYRFEIASARPPERLVHLVLLRDGDGYRPLCVSDGDAIARLSGRAAPGRSPAAIPVAAAQEKALARARDEVVAQAHEALALEGDPAREKAMRYAEDCLLAPREALEKARARLEEARKAVLAEEDPALRVRARGALERADRDCRRRRAQLRQEEDRQYAQLDRTLTLLAVRGQVDPRRTLIATAYFWIE